MRTPMTSRQRVQAALRHEEPDRVPIDFGGRHTVHVEVHRALKQHLGLEGGAEIVRSLLTNTAEPDPRLVEMFGGGRGRLPAEAGGELHLPARPGDRQLGGRMGDPIPEAARGPLLRSLRVPPGLGGDGGRGGAVPAAEPDRPRPADRAHRASPGGACLRRQGRAPECTGDRHLEVLLHACGSVYWAVPDLIEAGIDALNPVQVNAADMDPARLKREFGRDISFWGGGCDTILLQQGSPAAVEREVERRIAELAPGGGFVFGSIHNIAAGVPPENVVAMFRAAQKYGAYR